MSAKKQEVVDYLVVGAGVSGLSFCRWFYEYQLPGTVCVIESQPEPGGYCKTIHQDGFVWDYSGHFFHFRDSSVRDFVFANVKDNLFTVEKISKIRCSGRDIDFPFQKNIHQLPKSQFIDCLHDVYFRDQTEDPSSFGEMLHARFGRSISNLFLVPYNQKLYACDLHSLDKDAMGRFFPMADMADIVRNMKAADNSSYNATFHYPQGGAASFITALASGLPEGVVHLSEKLISVDIVNKVAQTTHRHIRYNRLVSSIPLPALAAACGLSHRTKSFSWNKVLVFNLGFDTKGQENIHWMYFPNRERRFYRVGWYDNITQSNRMSLYVEIGARVDEVFDIQAEKDRVVADLTAEGIVTDHKLISWHSVVLDPAYVHLTPDSIREAKALREDLHSKDIYSVGRYGQWTYCSIEDNIIETRDVAKSFANQPSC